MHPTHFRRARKTTAARTCRSWPLSQLGPGILHVGHKQQHRVSPSGKATLGRQQSKPRTSSLRVHGWARTEHARRPGHPDPTALLATPRVLLLSSSSFSRRLAAPPPGSEFSGLALLPHHIAWEAQPCPCPGPPDSKSSATPSRRPRDPFHTPRTPPLRALPLGGSGAPGWTGSQAYAS